MSNSELDKMEAEIKERAETGKVLIFPLEDCLQIIEDLRLDR